MTVRETVNLLSYGTPYILVGANTGKKLTNIYTKNETKEKYMDMSVSDTPIGVGLQEYKNSVINVTDFVKPIIYVWVSGM